MLLHRKYFLFSLLLSVTLLANSQVINKNNELSHAGFYSANYSPREVYNFNVGWRFIKSGVDGAENPSFDDSQWDVVNLPHSLELMPIEASGCINYQGEAWYRKQFITPQAMAGKRLFIHFEAAMGKSKVYLNGKLVKEQFGGYLPFIVDITDNVHRDGKKNVVAVMVDNSDDILYPPGKTQSMLDFTYFGGIYRDVWLYSTNDVHITDPNLVDKVAGGGIFVHCKELTKSRAVLSVSSDIANDGTKEQNITLVSTLLDPAGKIVATVSNKLRIEASSSKAVKQEIAVTSPNMWTPDNPALYRVVTDIKIGKTIVDNIVTRTGIRTIEFRGSDGFYLNGEPYNDKLIGTNRHQEFAYVGNAMTNSQHWRDAKKLKAAGTRIVRSAHYPQDPAFMDACDQLGLFVIVATPGWQYWGTEPIFEKRVYSDIRQMVRRDRNHPSVIMWEPILNETSYPKEFAKNAHDTTHEEYPYSGCYTACDNRAGTGFEYYDVYYSHPLNNSSIANQVKTSTEPQGVDGYAKWDKSMFCREWGDNVDDWQAQNSTSRMKRSWGEKAQLIQAKHYANPDYLFTSWDRFYGAPRQMVGGALWHSFDHNRGYHPDPFWGGIMDLFRQPKYSYYMFTSQKNPTSSDPFVENGPMVYIANEMSPDSPQDVTVYTNCEEVVLYKFGKEIARQRVADIKAYMPHPPVLFKDVYTFQEIKDMQRAKKHDQTTITAEGLISGKVVARQVKAPALRAVKIVLSVDYDGTPLIANGSDVVTVIASVIDAKGNVKRLASGDIRFEISGQGELVDAPNIGSNPRSLEWGTAPCLVRAKTTAGKITIKASMRHKGAYVPAEGSITIESVPSPDKLMFMEQPRNASGIANQLGVSTSTHSKSSAKELEEVERQQAQFEN